MRGRDILLRSGSTDADAANWKTRVLANGGTVSAGTLAAKSAFFASLKAAGIWSKINRMNLFSGDQLAAAVVPDKVGAGFALDALTNFVGGDYTEATGLKGNGSTKYLLTGALGSSYNFSDFHMSVFGASMEIGATTNGFIGTAAMDSAVAPFSVLSHSSSPQTQAAHGECLFSPTEHRILFAQGAKQYLMLSSTSSTLTTVYVSGASAGTDTNTKTGMNAGVIGLFCIPFGTTLVPISTNYFSAFAARSYTIGARLTGTEAANFHTYLSAYQTALGRA